MANALSTALFLKGADVCLITTNLERDSLPKSIHTVEVESANDMLEYTDECLRIAKKGKLAKASLNTPKAVEIIKKRPYLFMVSAVSDYRPKFQQSQKLKKSQLGGEWSLELVENPDILKSIDKEGIVSIAFKAETDEERGFNSAKTILEKKGVDGVCYNLISGRESFGGDTHQVTFITKHSSKELPKSSKVELAFEIINNAEGLSDE
jgi:phosphopantothenoylcysteine decarboxylase/phosphopantothenate--cysteine ligase